MGSTKIISIGNGGKNILDGIRKNFPSDMVTTSLYADTGIIDENAIKLLFPDDCSRAVLISCLGGCNSQIFPEVINVARDKGIECMGVCIMPFSSEGETVCHSAGRILEQIEDNVDILIVLKNDMLSEKYGTMPVNQAFGKMDTLVWTLIGNYMTND